MKKTSPEIVVRDGKAVAVILDIEEYRDILERLEDLEDIRMLDEMRKKPLKFRRLEDFLRERQDGVRGLSRAPRREGSGQVAHGDVRKGGCGNAVAL